MTGAKSKRPELVVEKREVLGRKVKSLRRQEILPGNVYGKGVASVAIQVPMGEFEKVYKEVGETGLVEVRVDGEMRPVLVHQVQVDPVTGELLHVDFRQVDLKEKTVVMVPVKMVGEAPAEKQGGVVVQVVDEIEVEALPTDLPEEVEMDISVLSEIGMAIKVRDLAIDRKKVEVKTGEDQIVVKVEAPAVEEEVPVVAEGEAVAAEGEVKVGEGEGEGGIEAGKGKEERKEGKQEEKNSE